MKVVCNRENLAKAFQLAASVAPSRSAKAILSNVKLTATNDTVELSATDMELGIRVALPEGSEIREPGSVLLPVQRTNSLLRESPDATLTIESDETGIIIKGGRSRFRLPSSSVDEFPAVSMEIKDKYHEVSPALLRELIHRTVFATDTESSRYALGGVLFESDGEKLFAVATDGRRLSSMVGTASAAGGHNLPMGTCIVPAKACTIIESSLREVKDTPVRICMSDNGFVVRAGRFGIYARLVEGRYPNWRQVIPNPTNPIGIEIPVGPFFGALRQAAVVVDNESRGIDFTFGGGVIKMEASTAEIGESRIEFSCGYEGEPQKLTLDHRFIADFLRVVPVDSMATLEVEEPSRPAVLKTEDGYTYVIMPMARDR